MERHKVLVLDDDDNLARIIEWSVKAQDYDAQCEIVHSVEEAKRALQNHFSEYHYALVDLHLGMTAPVGMTAPEHGEVFLKWLDQNGWLHHNVLAFSTYLDLVRKLPRSIQRKIYCVERLAADEFDEEVRKFVARMMREQEGRDSTQ